MYIMWLVQYSEQMSSRVRAPHFNGYTPRVCVCKYYNNFKIYNLRIYINVYILYGFLYLSVI